MQLSKVFATNKAKEEEGKWVDGPDKSRFRIARMGNSKYRAMLDKLLTPHRIALRQGRMDEKLLNKITIEVVSKTILLDWENVDLDANNLNVAYTPAIGAGVLAEYPDLADFITGQAQSFANYAAEQEAEELKNLPSVSPGN